MIQCSFSKRDAFTWFLHYWVFLLVTSHRFSQSQPELVTEHFRKEWLNNFRFNYLGAGWFCATFMQTPKLSYPSMYSYSSLVSKSIILLQKNSEKSIDQLWSQHDITLLHYPADKYCHFITLFSSDDHMS